MKSMLRRVLGEDIELISTTTPTLAKIVVDAGQMEQVIMNLVVNARDAMPRGGELSIETSGVLLDDAFAAQHLGVTAGPHVLLRVRDTGVGMDKATQARIFEPFFTTKDIGKGTGLGLSTVFGIVRQSGGTIAVFSQPDDGTRFDVYFPTANGVALRGSSVRPTSDIRALRGSETILLVEDDEHFRTLARTILSKYGYTVLEAQSGGDAFLLCEEYASEIHLLLTDVVMPRMSGRQLAERLLKIRPEMSVLYMSGYADEAVFRHGITDSAFMQKPITPETLASKVRATLGAAAHA
jgi:two-component system cell cycle sensor histidine kinase/response regulator CckA